MTIPLLTPDQIITIESSSQALQKMDVGSLLNRMITAINSGGGGGGAGFGTAFDGSLYVQDGSLIVVPYNLSPANLIVGMKTAPTGANLILELWYHATDPGSVALVATATVTAGQKTKIQALTGVSLLKGGFLIPKITQIGSTIPGSDLGWAITL